MSAAMEWSKLAQSKRPEFSAHGIKAEVSDDAGLKLTLSSNTAVGHDTWVEFGKWLIATFGDRPK